MEVNKQVKDNSTRLNFKEVSEQSGVSVYLIYFQLLNNEYVCRAKYFNFLLRNEAANCGNLKLFGDQFLSFFQKLHQFYSSSKVVFLRIDS